MVDMRSIGLLDDLSPAQQEARRAEVGQGLMDFSRGVTYAPFDLLGAPVDIANMGLQAVGMGSDEPFLGSQSLMNMYGQVMPEFQQPKNTGSEMAGRVAGGFVSPSAGYRSAQMIGKAVEKIPTKLEGSVDIDLLTGGMAPRPAAQDYNVPDDMMQVLDARAQQMELAPPKRIQPDENQNFFDTSKEAYETILAKQEEIAVPRAPEGVEMPQNNRAGKLKNVEDEVSSVIAERIIPYKNSNVRYFYNTAPIVTKAMELGVSQEKAMKQLERFADYYAATSPRTKTEPNLLNASMVYAKNEAGIPFDEIVGVNRTKINAAGAPELNEKGYPMILSNPSGIHRLRLDDVEGEGISYKTNPKPFTFAENVKGNLTGVTADTHAIRGALDAMNEVKLGSIPEEFILKKYREQYKKDPSSFDPAIMVDDQLKTQKIKGETVQAEYSVFSDLYKKVAEKAGITPAEAQALAWFSTGDKTGLASDQKTLVDLVSERVDVTSKATGQSKEEVFKKFFSGKMPLMSFAGATVGAGILDGDPTVTDPQSSLLY